LKFIHRAIFEALTDGQLMGLCIEREAGGEPFEGRVAVGTVILERVDHRKWDGENIHEVILKDWQFSWTMDQAGEGYYLKSVQMAQNFDNEVNFNTSLMDCYVLAQSMISGATPRDPDLAAAHCCQYLNPKVAATIKAKWLKAGMRVIKAIGQHEFFV
jgi:hypothetical protein